MIAPGQPAPWFTAATPSNPRFAFSSLGGRFILLAFLPDEPEARARAVEAMQAHRDLFDDVRLAAFGVLRDPEAIATAKDQPNLRWFFDPNGEVSRQFGALDGLGEARPSWVVVDPSLRVLAWAPIEQAERVFATLRGLPAPDDHAGAPLSAPVLIVPRIFEPQVCRRLIELYETEGGAPSGTMREVNGKTVGVLDRSFKRRSDATVEDEGFKAELRARIAARLLPEIEKAFQFRATRIERYIVARYDGAEGGFFRAHRDNTTRGTAHRKFACSINLNAEAFEGGDLRFPEFGGRTYRPPTGGAVVFSCSLLHEATPVTRGRRYAFLPFLYDEAGARIRQENLQFLAAGPDDRAPARAAADARAS